MLWFSVSPECVTVSSEVFFSGGELAQMVERSLSMREVAGSMPAFSSVCFQLLFRYKPAFKNISYLHWIFLYNV